MHVKNVSNELRGKGPHRGGTSVEVQERGDGGRDQGGGHGDGESWVDLRYIVGTSRL